MLFVARVARSIGVVLRNAVLLHTVRFRPLCVWKAMRRLEFALVGMAGEGDLDGSMGGWDVGDGKMCMNCTTRRLDT